MTQKTLPTPESVADFIAAISDPEKRRDAADLCALLESVSGEPPVMWGNAIVGFGSYHYVYASGHEGDAPRIGFSPRKVNLTVYIVPGFDGREALVARLGKVKTALSCLYIKRLADIDRDVLRDLALSAWTEMRERYPV